MGSLTALVASVVRPPPRDDVTAHHNSLGCPTELHYPSTHTKWSAQAAAGIASRRSEDRDCCPPKQHPEWSKHVLIFMSNCTTSHRDIHIYQDHTLCPLR